MLYFLYIFIGIVIHYWKEIASQIAFVLLLKVAHVAQRLMVIKFQKDGASS